MHRRNLLFLVPISVVSLSVPSCGDRDDGAAAAKSETGPLYVISTAVFGPESTTTYLLTVPSIDAATEPDYENAVVMDNFASMFGRSGRSDIYVGSGESPEITKWTVEADGRLSRGTTVSFASLGVESGGQYPEYVKFISDTKAYFYDFGTRRLVVWNPAEMTLTGEVELPVESEGSLQPAAGDGLVLRPDGTLLLGLYWWNSDTQQGGDRVRVIAVDTTTDRVVDFSDDQRCGDNYSTSVASDGTAYFSGGASSQVTRILLGEGYGATPCHLRVVPPGRAIDSAYSVDLSILTGGRPTGEFILVDDETAFVRAWHDEDAPPFDGNVVAHTSQPAYRWWRWTLGEPQATLAQADAAKTSGGLRYFVDGRTYVTDSSADYSTTTLTELSGDRGVVPGITVRGYPYGVVRVR